MDNLFALTLVIDATRQSRRQLQFGIDRFQKDCATVRAAIRLIEAHRNAFGKNVGKQNRLCGILSHQKASVCVRKACLYLLYTQAGAFCFSPS